MSDQSLNVLWALEIQHLPTEPITGQQSATCAFVLATIANFDFDQWPSADDLCRYTKLPNDAVLWALRELHDNGLLQELRTIQESGLEANHG